MKSVRWWPLALILFLEAGVLVLIWLVLDTPVRQARVVPTIASLAVGFGAVGVWFLFFSRLGWKWRLGGLALAIVLVSAFALLFRFEGMNGDLVPQFRLRLGGVALVRGNASLAGFYTLDYPQFQGPRRDAVLPEIGLSSDWGSDPPALLWRREVGEGIAGFSIAGRLAITQEQDEEGENVVAYDLASGDPVWEHRTPGRYESPIAGKGPRSLPTIAGGRVFTMGSTGWLTALDLSSGGLLWARNVLQEHQRPVPMWGKSCSPLVLEDRVIISIYRTALVAYAAADGALLWEQGADGANYSSPTVLDLAGRRQIVSFNALGPAGYDARDGRPLWQFPWASGTERIALPVQVSPNRILVSSGYGEGTRLLEITPAEDSLQVRELWHSIRLKSKFANFLVIGEHIYGLDDGILTCLELATGERVWKEGRYGHGQMIRVDDRILLLAEDGRLVLIEPSPQGLRELSSFQALDGHTWNPPALAGELLVVRNNHEAACYRLPLR